MRRRRLIAALWIAVAAGWFVAVGWSGDGHVGTIRRILDASAGSWWAAAAFVLLSVVRPFVLLPATSLTVAAGYLFGPVVGVLVAAAGANASALVAHAIGGAFATDSPGAGRIESWRERLNHRAFEAVLVMRLVFVPYDAVNYGAGYLGVPGTPFLVATVLGTLPGTVSFVLLGASLPNLDELIGGVDRRALVASVLIAALSVLVARALRRSRAA